ncbi:MAG: radical SAM protein, partial [Desulfomonile sp.]|nr:radical SAM protein [Desulfomonile sp.]
VEDALSKGRTIGLVGSDLASHPQLEEILAFIVERGGRFSLSSIRPEGLTPEVIALMVRSGQKTATLAPEVASDRLKKVVGKEVPSESFLALIERLVTAGVPNVRFYFMIGLPTETDDDVRAIVEFILRAREVFVNTSRAKRRIGRLSVQTNPFVPKPWTPFQWAPMAELSKLEARAALLKAGLKRAGDVTLRIESPREALVQAVISRGDRRLAAALLDAASRPGALLHSLKKEPPGMEFYVLRERNPDETFPWDIVSHGVSRKALRKLYEGALKAGMEGGIEDSR